MAKEKLSKVKRCVRLAANEKGRDLVVGDLHGHRSLLERELERLGFDAGRDRVLSVGDLVDRGPESLHTLALIEEPWFHAVLGNHELMLLSGLGYYGSSQMRQRKVPAACRSGWLEDALARHRKRLCRLADRLAALPMALHVQGEVAFNVMHGDLEPIGSCQQSLFGKDTIRMHEADELACSRSNLEDALALELHALSFASRSVQVSGMPMGELPITYVGHSPIRHVTVHNSYVYIDQGVCAPRFDGQGPTVLDHRQFAYWLGGVASARVQLALA